jgi:trehalose-phosphatase
VIESGIEIDGWPFWGQLARAPAAALLLDYDGTLAPFRVERERARPYAGVRERLKRIADCGRTRVVIVSGRIADEVHRLLDLEPSPEIWGVHGLERRTPDGSIHRAELDPSVERRLAEAARRGWEIMPKERVEEKTGAVAFHWRGLEPGKSSALADRLERLLQDLANDPGLVLHPFDGGLELRVAAASKDRAVNAVLAEPPAGAVVAYLGDDRTDEDAFRALRNRGLGVLVSAHARPTAATVRLEPPQGVLEFLDRWDRARREEGSFA